MKIDLLVAEIGSTTTKVNAFDRLESDAPVFLGQGHAPTSVEAGDVTVGLEEAIRHLRTTLGDPLLDWRDMVATSSAAGGLRMTVHGLVRDMTVRAAEEAALGAGAIIQWITAGKLLPQDLDQVKQIRPSLILVAGGVDFGERETALFNFKRLAQACPDIPLIYAGNAQNQDEVRRIAGEEGVRAYVIDNVYPSVDQLEVEQARRIIHDAFEDHIVHAPGMTRIRELVSGPIIPTPGAVMEAARLLHGILGDVIVVDIGGATTDLHSVTAGSEEIGRMLVSPEPFAKRTVEGDLGVFVNRMRLVDRIGWISLSQEFPDAASLNETVGAIPQNPEQVRFIERLAREAAIAAMDRHAGRLKDLYGPTGKKTIAVGKDLTAVRTVIGTGGALSRLPGGKTILQAMLSVRTGNRLYPPEDATVRIDKAYVLSAIGVLSKRFPLAAERLLRQQFLEETPG